MNRPTISELMEAHVSLQLGTYFDRVHTLASDAKYASSRLIDDFYWNYAYDISSDVSRAADLIAEIRQYAASIGRKPVIYVNPDTRPVGLADSLSAESAEKEVWMTYSGSDDPSPRAPNLDIEHIDEPRPGTDFLEVFKDAYGSGPVDSPGYTGLPEKYVNSIAECQPRDGVEVAHFIGRVGGKAATIASIFYAPPWAGLYNVGTVHSARRSHFAWDVSAAAVRFAIQCKSTNIFLQTEADSPVEEFYVKLGFVREFVGELLVL